VANVPDSEWAVLELLWQRGAATARKITEALYPRQTPSDQATVYKLLERLEDKGLITRERGGSAHQFRAAADRDTLVGQQLEALLDRTGGSLQPLLTNLIRGGRLTPEQLRELRDLVDRLGQEPRRKKGKG
jgi:predicted transcriptional regulator